MVVPHWLQMKNHPFSHAHINVMISVTSFHAFSRDFIPFPSFSYRPLVQNLFFWLLPINLLNKTTPWKKFKISLTASIILTKKLIISNTISKLIFTHFIIKIFIHLCDEAGIYFNFLLNGCSIFPRPFTEKPYFPYITSLTYYLSRQIHTSLVKFLRTHIHECNVLSHTLSFHFYNIL